jgi:hypothetical protein
LQVPISGTATAPQLVFAPGAQSSQGLGLREPLGTALDQHGDLFIADSGNNRVIEIPAGGGAQKTVVSGLNFPEGVAVDRLGNLFIADADNRRIVEEPASGGAFIVFASGFNLIAGIAVDADENIYVADSDGQAVYKFPSGSSTPVPIGSGWGDPFGITIDAEGDLFITDAGLNQVYKYPAGGGLPITLPFSGLNYPTGVAVDAVGNVFVSDTVNHRVEELTANGGNQITLLGGLSYPYLLSLDASGDLFIPDLSNNRVIELNPYQAPTLNFPSTIESQTSASQSVTLYNTGNTALSLSGLNVGSGFAQVAGGGSPADCTASTNLASGASCNLSLSFEPTGSGAIQTTVALTDNSLNQTNATQSIQLNGTGLLPSQTIDFTPPTSPVNYGVSPITLVATGGASGNPVVFSIVSGPGSLSGTNGSTLTITGVGTIVVAANQAGNTSYAPATQVTESVVVNAAPQTIVFPAPASPVNYGVSPITLAATGGASGNPVVFSVVSGPGSVSGTNGSMLTITGVGTVVVAANQAGNTLYAAGTQVTQSVVVNASPQSISFPAPASPVTYPVSPIALSATGGASGNPVVFSVVSGPGTVSGTNGTTLTITDAGTVVVAANQAGSSVYAAATQVTQSIVVNPPAAAILISPKPGSQLAGTGVTFTWTPAAGVTNYWFNLGTAASGANAKNIYSSGSVTALSETVTALPTNGETIYATLYSQISGVFQPTVYTFYAYGPAVLTAPAAGTKLTASTTFTWTPGTGITTYWLNVGTAATSSNAKDIYSSGPITTLTKTVTGIPTYGATLYVTLYSLIAGVYQPIVYTYTASGSPVAATLTTPTPSTKLTSSNVTFTWSGSEGVTYYWFNLGTTDSGTGAKNLYSTGSTTLISANVTGLPTNGETIYATLYSYIAGVWEPTVYTYTASGTPSPAVLTTPTPSTALTSPTVTFTWSAGNPATNYWIDLGTASSGANAKNIYSGGSTTATSVTVTGLPTNGETIYATLYSYIDGAWQPIVYTYKAE